MENGPKTIRVQTSWQKSWISHWTRSTLSFKLRFLLTLKGEDCVISIKLIAT